MPLIADGDSVLWGDYSPNYEYVCNIIFRM